MDAVDNGRVLSPETAAEHVTVLNVNSSPFPIGFYLIGIFSYSKYSKFSPSNVGNFLSNNILSIKIKPMKELSAL